MPEHVRLLISEPCTATPSTVLQALKQTVSRALRRSGKEDLRLQRLEHGEDFRKLEYMHENPVKRGLVLNAKDWPWSSCSHYAKPGPGLVTIDALSQQTNPRENPHPQKPKGAAPNFASAHSVRHPSAVLPLNLKFRFAFRRSTAALSWIVQVIG
jgi:hypothetical protein